MERLTEILLRFYYIIRTTTFSALNNGAQLQPSFREPQIRVLFHLHTNALS